MIKDYDYLFKIVLVGNSSVGKSSFLRRYCDDLFQQSYLPTIGVDFRFKSISSRKGIVKLQIWDTAGQQRFATITSAYYKGVHGIILVYDLNSQQSFEDIKDYWHSEVQKYGERNVKLYLIGNKSDFQTKVNKEEVQLFCREKNITHFEVSAKTGNNVGVAMEDFAQKLTQMHQKIQNKEDKNKKKNEGNKKKQFKLNSPAVKTKSKNLCCG